MLRMMFNFFWHHQPHQAHEVVNGNFDAPYLCSLDIYPFAGSLAQAANPKFSLGETVLPDENFRVSGRHQMETTTQVLIAPI